MNSDRLRRWNAPDEIAELYPVINDWRRQYSWFRSRRRHHFEATYTRVLAGKVQTARVTIHERVIADAEMPRWILQQLDRAAQPDHPNKSRDVVTRC